MEGQINNTNRTRHQKGNKNEIKILTNPGLA